MALMDKLIQNNLVSSGNFQLYHGSGYEHELLKPGFNHSGKSVSWDGYENNTWLYATTDQAAATMLGISSAWEKRFKLKHTSIDYVFKQVNIQFCDKVPAKEELTNVDVYVYSVVHSEEDGWVKNNNPNNKIESEWKTQNDVSTNIIDCKHIDVAEYLKGWRINASL